MEITTTLPPETLVANPLPQGSYASGTQLNCLLYYSGGRPWYATVLPYSVIGTLVQTTQGRSSSILECK